MKLEGNKPNNNARIRWDDSLGADRKVGKQ